MAPKFTFVYFNGRGRAEFIRLLFAAAGLEFEDKRVAFEEWPAMKGDMPQGCLPVLIIKNGKEEEKIGQTYAIARFIAKETKQYGSNVKEELYIEELMEACKDLLQTCLQSKFEKDEKVKAEKIKKVEEEKKKVLPLIEKSIASRGKGFAVGAKPTIADAFLYAMVETLECEKEIKDCKKLSEVIDKFAAIKTVKTYLGSRPKTPF